MSMQDLKSALMAANVLPVRDSFNEVEQYAMDYTSEMLQSLDALGVLRSDRDLAFWIDGPSGPQANEIKDTTWYIFDHRVLVRIKPTRDRQAAVAADLFAVADLFHVVQLTLTNVSTTGYQPGSHSATSTIEYNFIYAPKGEREPLLLKAKGLNCQRLIQFLRTIGAFGSQTPPQKGDTTVAT